jgi:hypothetical protein
VAIRVADAVTVARADREAVVIAVAVTIVVAVGGAVCVARGLTRVAPLVAARVVVDAAVVADRIARVVTGGVALRAVVPFVVADSTAVSTPSWRRPAPKA